MPKPSDIASLSFETNPYIRRIHAPLGDTRFLNLKEILRPADEHNFGILAANAVIPEMLYAVLDAAFDTDSPVIIEVAGSGFIVTVTSNRYDSSVIHPVTISI